MASCSSDAECRTDEGYLCDRQWRACTLANFAAIVPSTCGAVPGFGRDAAFAPTTALTTANSPGSYQRTPSAVIAGDGAVVALYVSGGTTAADDALGLVRIDTANRTTYPAFPAAAGRDPRLARAANGTLYAVWLALERREIALATSTDHGATWSNPIAVNQSGDCGEGDDDCPGEPVVIVGADPRRTGHSIVYVAYSAAGMRVRASRDGGATFGRAVTPLAGGHGDLAVGGDGALYAIAIHGGWRGGYGSADHRVEFSASHDGAATFARPQAISRDGEPLPFWFANPSIVVDTKRKWLYAAYVRGGRDGVWDVAIAAAKTDGKTWSWNRARIGDDPACAIHMVPNLALDPTTGALHVAWYDSRGPRFAHAWCTPGAARCAQLGRINDRPFATLATGRYDASWIGEYQTLIVDDARRTLRAVWTQPIDDGGIASRIFHARARLPVR